MSQQRCCRAMKPQAKETLVSIFYLVLKRIEAVQRGKNIIYAIKSRFHRIRFNIDSHTTYTYMEVWIFIIQFRDQISTWHQFASIGWTFSFREDTFCTRSVQIVKFSHTKCSNSHFSISLSECESVRIFSAIKCHYSQAHLLIVSTLQGTTICTRACG